MTFKSCNMLISIEKGETNSQKKKKIVQKIVERKYSCCSGEEGD